MSANSEKNTRAMRIWTHLNPEEVTSRLLLVDDLYGSCANCKQLGLNYLKDTTCPGCGAEFQYLAVNSRSTGEVVKILNRIRAENLPYRVVERQDLEKASAHDALGDLFKK